MSSTAKEVHAAAAKSYDNISQKHKVKETPKPFRHFNNHIKKQLIQLAIDYQRAKLVGQPAGSSTTTQKKAARGVRVLDLASGRGGDMGKWVYGCSPPLGGAPPASPAPEKIVVEVYHAYDISKQSVEEAEKRYDFLVANPNPHMPLFAKDVHFGVANTFTEYFYNRLCSNNNTNWEVENKQQQQQASPVAPPMAIGGDEEEESHVKVEKVPAFKPRSATTTEEFATEADSMTTTILPVEPEFYDIVSVQFAFHYGCNSHDAVTHTLHAISSVMNEDAIFIATIVDCEELSRRFVLDEKKSNSNGGSAADTADTAATLGNGLFEIRFDCDNIKELNLIKEAEEDASVEGNENFMLPFGARYHFLLEGHVDCDEYAVPMDKLLKIAASVNLEVVPEGTYKFKDQIEKYQKNPKIKKQLQGETMSSAEIELVSMYRTVAFRKKRTV